MFGLYKKLIPSAVHTVQNSYENFKFRNKLLFFPSFVFFRQIVFCSHASYESFPGFYRWLAAGRMDVVQNGVDLNRIDRVTKAKPTVENDQFTLATVGLIQIKNPITVLDASYQYNDRDTKLIFLGEGSLRPILTQKVESLGLQQQVQLTGMVARDLVFEYFALADLFVSASWGEGLPVAVMEAMACGCPVVLSDIPPHREIAEGVDFIPLFKPDDVKGFAREIKKFREMSVAERKAVGQKCRRLIEERFSLPIMHAGYKEIYNKITGNQVPSVLEMIG
jgi:glycosyltransferase involved in cell wall biosynthesis